MLETGSSENRLGPAKLLTTLIFLRKKLDGLTLQDMGSTTFRLNLGSSYRFDAAASSA
jgi:hypothetical protein